MSNRLTHSLALVLITSSALLTHVSAADAKADETKNKTTGRNRGPENPELVFKLPPPPVLTAEQELKTFKLPKGFKIQLVASEPMIESPVSMSWDDQGRLYVVEMIGYMQDVNAKGEDQPVGRIKRLEDTDDDGVMDKATIFVDKLFMPRSVTAFGDGAIVAEPPNLTFYHDTDSDGLADKNEVIATGFGTKGGQPEHMANALTFGQDNWLVGAGYSQRLRYVKGQFISEPTKSGGQWGLTQDDWGRRYFNYNSDFLRTDLLPPSIYSRNPNLADRLALNWQVMKDQAVWPSVPTPGVNRGYNKGQLRDDGRLATCTGTCGAVIYRGDLFGQEFSGNAFIPEPCGNLVKRVILSETGGVVTGKNAYDGKEFLTSTDERFRPVNAYNGPDGALYIVDLARGVVQHKAFLTHYLIANIEARKLEQPVNLGRIWRVVPEDKTKPLAVKLPRSKDVSSLADPARQGQDALATVPYLDHPNGHIRDTAQRVLVERSDAAAVEALKKLALEAKLPQGRVHALWTLEGLNQIALPPEVLTACLHDKHEKVRATAVRLGSLAHMPEFLKMTKDPSAEVRMQLAAQLSAMPGPEAQQAVLAILKEGGSPLLNDAIATGVRGRELDYLEKLMTESVGKPDKLVTSGLLQMLANCVMTERRSAKVSRLLELTAEQAEGSPRYLALLDGLVGTPVGKKADASSSKPNVRPRKLLYLEAQPAALTTLLNKASKQNKPLLAMVDKGLAWPGKEGVPPPPVVIPLTAEQQVLFDKGKLIYAGLCASCHQPTGSGLDGLAPPLVDSDWVLGKSDVPIRIVLHGVGGPLNVSGRTWRLEMPPLPVFSDEDIASVLTYIRREWEHNASPVSPAEVAMIREANKTRTHSWTEAELKGSPTKTVKK